MALQKVKDSMRTTTALDSTKLSGNLPAISGASLTNLDRRNFIIDGDFTQWPEGNITAIANSAYGAALWENFDVGGELVHDVDQLSDAPTVAESSHGSTYSMSIDITTAESAVAVGDFQVIEYKVTGSDFAHLHRQQVTLSFWHKHTKTGIFCGYFMNSASDRSYVYEYTQSTTNTWERHTETLTLDASGTWIITEAGGIGLRVGFCMYGGSTFQGTADSWEGAKDYCTSNQVAGADNAANFCKFSQVALYLGSTAPTFVAPPVATVKNQVDWYVQRYNYDTASAENIALGGCNSTTATVSFFAYRRAMRATPAITSSAAGTFIASDFSTNSTASSVAYGPINKYNFIFNTVASSMTVGRAIKLTRDATDTCYIMADARH